MLAVVLCASVALGQDQRSGHKSRGRTRGDGASASGSSRLADARTAAFLRRVDTNGNGMIDAEEVAGPHKTFVEGVLTQMGVELKYPISLSKIAPATNADRTGGSGDDADGRSGNSSRTQPKNGFGQTKSSPPAVFGFGQASEKSNGSGTKAVATSGPAGAAASSSPSAAAKRGDTPSGSASAKSDPSPDSPKRSGPKSGRFLTPKERLPKGLPEWFLEKDADGDGQVCMAEFASDWTPDVVAEFERYDLNHDGVITPAECLKAMEGPHRKSK